MADPILTERELDELSYHLDHLVRPQSGSLGTLAGTAVRYLSGILGAEGVPCEVLEADGGSSCLVARLSAHRPDEGLLLVASSDPPTAGTVTPRQALLGGTMAAVGLMALALVRRRGFLLERDLVLAVLPGRGPDGAPVLRHLAARHRDRLRCRYVLTADGVGPRRPGNRTLVGVQVASKAWLRVRVTALAESRAAGPASAATRLVRSLLQIESGVLGTRPCAPAVAWMDAVASTLPSGSSAMLRGIQLLGAGASLSRLVSDRDLAATLASISRDTVEIVGLRAGEAGGLPPGRAEAELALRVLPGRRVEESIRELQSLLGAEVTVDAVESVEAVEMPHPSPLWDRIGDAVGRFVPDATLVPTLDSDAWDAAALAPLDVTAYGFGPLAVLDDSVLSAPESGPGIAPEALRRGAEAFLRVVLGTCIPDAFPMSRVDNPGPRI